MMCASFSLQGAFFQANKNQPYHLSVGVVLFNSEGKVACHHFKEILGHKDIYILMRESMEDNETPLITAERGLKEEFGATGTPLAFIGSLAGYLPDSKLSFEKTTLYIAYALTELKEEDRDTSDIEASSSIEWFNPDDLILLMQKQGARFNHRIDADESEMIKRALPYFKDIRRED